jgi:hypothetical protein
MPIKESNSEENLNEPLKGRLGFEELRTTQDRLTHTDGEIQNPCQTAPESGNQLNVLFDQLRLAGEESSKTRHEMEKLRADFILLHEQNRKIEEQLKLERQERLSLLIRMQLEQEQRRAAEEQQKKQQEMDAIAIQKRQKEVEAERKLAELLRTVGSPLRVRRFGRNGFLSNVDFNLLTPDMIKQIQTVKDQWSKLHKVKRFDYVMNNYLYKRFDNTKSEFKRLKRGTKEILVFHGTNRNNINKYDSAVLADLEFCRRVSKSGV